MSDKSIAAKISAYWNSWDEQLFAEHAEKGLVYRQVMKSAPEEKIFAFVIGQDNEDFPVRQLTDIEAIPNLAIVLPIDVLNLRVLSLVSFIEVNRRVSSASSGSSELKIKDMYSLEVVGEVGKNTNGAIYGYAMFNSSNELVSALFERVTEKLGEKQRGENVVELLKFSDDEFRNAIRGIFRPTTNKMALQIINGSVVRLEGMENW